MIWIFSLLKVITIIYVLSGLFEFLGTLLAEAGIVFKKKLYAVIFNLFVYLLMCNKCNSFWSTLIITGDLFTAAAVAIIINIIKSLEYKLIKTEL